MEVLSNAWWTGQVGSWSTNLYTEVVWLHMVVRLLCLVTAHSYDVFRKRLSIHTAHLLQAGLVAVHQLLLYLCHGFCDAQYTITDWYWDLLKTIFLQMGVTLGSTKNRLVSPKAAHCLGWQHSKRELWVSGWLSNLKQMPMGFTEDKMPGTFPERPGAKLKLSCDVLSYQQYHPLFLILSQWWDVSLDCVKSIFSEYTAEHKKSKN